MSAICEDAAPPGVPRAAGRWQAWRARYGLAEACGTACAVLGFAAGYLPAGSLLARPGCLAGAAWLLRPLPGGVWLGFALGKAAADAAWYALEASARRGVVLCRADRPVRSG